MKSKEQSLSEKGHSLEIHLSRALELANEGHGVLIDIRQGFEIRMKGAIPNTLHLPMLELKAALGHELTEDEQDTLDAYPPKDIGDALDQLEHARDRHLLCICNSGRRSLIVAEWLRSLGHAKAISVAGGFVAWKQMRSESCAA